jgi:hypothetical protein
LKNSIPLSFYGAERIFLNTGPDFKENPSKIGIERLPAASSGECARRSVQKEANCPKRSHVAGPYGGKNLFRPPGAVVQQLL